MESKEIIQALETCLQIEHIKLYCCDKESKTTIINITDIRDLINRQQAEIERLTDRNKRLGEGVGWLLNNENGIELIRAEAIKEFINELMLQMPEHIMRTKPQPEEWRIKRWINFALEKVAPELIKGGSFFDNPNLQKTR